MIADLIAERCVARPIHGGRGRALLTAPGSLGIELGQHFRGDGAALVIDDLAMTVEDDGLRHGCRAAHEIPDRLIICFNGEGHDPIAAKLSQILHRIIGDNIRVQGQHGDIALMLLVELTKMRQLFDAGAAVSRPEVDEHGLAAGFGQGKGAAVQTFNAEIGELIADLVSERCVARPIHGGRGRGDLGHDGVLSGSGVLLFDVGIEEIVVQKRRAQHRQGNPPGDLRKALPFRLGIRLVVRTAAGWSFQGKLARFQTDRLLVANVHTLGAVDALMIAHMAHVHPTGADAGAAAVAARGVHLHADQRELAEKAIDRAQRAEKAAEAAIAEHAGETDDQHDDKLACEQNAQHGEVARVTRVGEQHDRALEDSGGADVFAEARQRYAVGYAVPGRDPDGKDREEDVLEPGQRAGHTAFLDLRGRQLVQQLLNEPEGAEPAADRAPEDQAVEHQDTEDVPADLLVGGADGVLQGAQRAGPHRAGAGIAVEAGNTEPLGRGAFALVDLALDKAFDMGVIQQGAVELNEPSLGRAVGGPPGGFYIIQGQHTPYKF